MERFQMDLLQRLTMSGGMEPEFQSGGEELELSLGLSLGGSYGGDKVNERSLVRSSSVAVTMAESMEEDEDEDEEVSGMAAALVRTASLPVEAAEEWRKRKELQTLRRMEAKRRRCEKQRVGRAEKEGEAAATAAAAFLAAGKAASPGESQGGSSSGVSEPDSKSGRGWWQGEWRRGGKESRGVGIEDMPCVFTKGDGPEGRRVEGILYKYGQREEVRIMCVCHGRFLSPSDFIKHAGGSHVSNPLRHIVVTPSSFF